MTSTKDNGNGNNGNGNGNGNGDGKDGVYLLVPTGYECLDEDTGKQVFSITPQPNGHFHLMFYADVSAAGFAALSPLVYDALLHLEGGTMHAEKTEKAVRKLHAGEAFNGSAAARGAL